MNLSEWEMVHFKRIMDPTTLYPFLDRLSIHYEHHAHVPVFTSEQARRLIPTLPGAAAKNLFLGDKKGRRYFLLVLEDTKKVDLKILANGLGLPKLSLASPRRLMEYLGVEPGAVSLLALVNDYNRQVEVLIDKDIWQAQALQCHPLVNTATLVISMRDVKRFLQATGHTLRALEMGPFLAPSP